MTEPLFKFTVYRDSWYRGNSYIDTTLYSRYPGINGRACYQGCCLGHALNDLGFGTDIIENMGDVSEVHSHTQLNYDRDFRKTNDVFRALCDVETRAIEVNDDDEISDEEREKKLKEIFNDANIEIEFKDGKREWKTSSDWLQ